MANDCRRCSMTGSIRYADNEHDEVDSLSFGLQFDSEGKFNVASHNTKLLFGKIMVELLRKSERNNAKESKNTDKVKIDKEV